MTEPTTNAGKALVEWAANAMPAQQQDVWREHAVAIEREAARLDPERLFRAMVRAGDIHGVIEKGEATREVARAIAAAYAAAREGEA